MVIMTGYVMRDVPEVEPRPRQIHQGLGASGANPKGQVQASGLCGDHPVGA